MKMEALSAKVRDLVARNIPSVHVVRVSSDPIVDSTGDDSLGIRVVLDARPADQSSKYATVVDQLRTWLAEQEDQRFPYIDFITEQEEQELQQAE
ncbi:MAG: hypothetical protein JOY77_08710 [Alphaproteobacteria bacterium]|nr:hypothetical protein [Alphaproteobacteria bacterium]MBV9062992.1 hypothetical protein [Alphaproteobacteria bacterium]